MVKKNNRNDGDVKPFQKIIGIASLLKNEPSTSHRFENWPSPRSTSEQIFLNKGYIGMGDLQNAQFCDAFP